MARVSYLERRKNSGVYYARIYIPQDLVAHFGADNKKVSLRTKDEAQAKGLLRQQQQRWSDIFADVRSRRELDDDIKAQATWLQYETILNADEGIRRTMPTPLDIQREEEKVWSKIDKGEIGSRDFIGMVNAHADLELISTRRQHERNLRHQRANALRAHLNTGQTVLVDDSAQRFITEQNLIVAQGSAEYADLCYRLMRAEIEALERTFERDDGNYGGSPRDPLIKPVAIKDLQKTPDGETILKLFDRYAAENPRGISDDTLAQARRDIRSFVDVAGSHCPASKIDKKIMREWKALLMRYPVKATETKIFHGLTMTQIVTKNEQAKKPTLTTRTVNRYLSSLGAFCNWLVSNGYLDKNPTEGMFLPKDTRKKVFPFDAGQMNVIFNSPLFTGCESDDDWRHISRPGTVRISDYRYWVPLIMLFSGARPGEIAQLAVADVRFQDDQWIMHITEEGDDGKQVKTKGSMRVVPVHPELMRLGFIQYHAAMAAKGHLKLFPTATRNSRGQMIADFSKAFGPYLTKLGVKVGRGLSLYSFRHGLTDALRRAGFLDEDFGFILGHAKATTTGRYGILTPGILARRVELINSVSYPGLDLEHLMQKGDDQSDANL